MERIEVVQNIMQVVAANTAKAGRVPVQAVLWMMIDPRNGRAVEGPEPLIEAMPGPETQPEFEAWFQSVERKAAQFDAVAALLACEVTDGSKRFAVVQLEERGCDTRIWKARMQPRAGGMSLERWRERSDGVSTMRLLALTPGQQN